MLRNVGHQTADKRLFQFRLISLLSMPVFKIFYPGEIDLRISAEHEFCHPLQPVKRAGYLLPFNLLLMKDKCYGNPKRLQDRPLDPFRHSFYHRAGMLKVFMIDRLERPVEVNDAMDIRLEPDVVSGNDVLTVRDLSKAFGSHLLFSHVDLRSSAASGWPSSEITAPGKPPS